MRYKCKVGSHLTFSLMFRHERGNTRAQICALLLSMTGICSLDLRYGTLCGYWWFCKEFEHGLISNAVLIHVMCFRRLSTTEKIHIGSCIWKLYRMLANSALSQLWSFVNTWGLSLPPSWDCIRLATCDLCKWIRSNVSSLTASHFHTAIQQIIFIRLV